MTEKEDFERAIDEMLSRPAPLEEHAANQNLETMSMAPTVFLRFVEKTRTTLSATYPEGMRTTKALILQQWWIDNASGDGEWRDIPVEKL